MPPNDRSAAMEAFRRRAQLGPPSAAGMQGANLNPAAMMPRDVLAQRTFASQSPQPAATMSQPGIDQLQKSQPGEAEIIIKALIQRLRNLAPTGGFSPTGGPNA